MFSKYPVAAFSVLCVFLLSTNSLFVGHVVQAGGVSWSSIDLKDPQGKPIVLPPGQWKVICFLGSECPLAKLYGPRLQAMSDEFAKKDVVFLGINSNPQDSPSDIQQYIRSHEIRFPVAKDADQSIADSFGAERTPEVFVVDSKGAIRYRGRIDDQYEPGVARKQPTTHDLRDALTALTNGKPVRQTNTPGVGCLITRIKNDEQVPASKATVTFHRDISVILNNHCVECHRKGEIAPMALTDYDEVVGWGQMILEVIDEKRMPPWHADPDVGHIAGARILPADARATIAKWIDEGMHAGTPEDQPPSPEWATGWHMETEPELVYEMRDRPFHVPADETVEYQYFVVDPKWETDRWIRAAQVVPGDASVVHHSIVFVRPPDNRAMHGIGWLGAYVPGQKTIELPAGHARLVPAGSKFVFQMHYTPNGRETPDLSKVGIWEIPAAQVTHQVLTEIAIDHEFEIPPGESNFVVRLSESSFPEGGRMLGIAPHMHLRGKSFRLHQVSAAGEKSALLSVPRYDFNWQHYYEFEQPVELDRTRTLEMEVAFDNSTKNPFNPDATEYVSWGDQTWEEMAIAFYDVAVNVDSAGRRKHHYKKPTDDEIAEFENRVEQHIAKFMKKMDVDGNGKVEFAESNKTFQKFVFRSYDTNNDQVLDRDEIEQAARQSPGVTQSP